MDFCFRRGKKQEDEVHRFKLGICANIEGGTTRFYLLSGGIPIQCICSSHIVQGDKGI